MNFLYYLRKKPFYYSKPLTSFNGFFFNEEYFSLKQFDSKKTWHPVFWCHLLCNTFSNHVLCLWYIDWILQNRYFSAFEFKCQTKYGFYRVWHNFQNSFRRLTAIHLYWIAIKNMFSIIHWITVGAEKTFHLQ